MAEVVVGIVKDKLVSLLTEEVSLLKDVDNEVAEIARELGSILAFLKDADKRAETEGDDVRDGVKSWVQDLREVAFEVEDVVTNYTYHLSRKPNLCHQRGFFECLRGIACYLPLSFSSLKRRRDLAWQIQSIKMTLIKVHERSKTYGFINSFQQLGSITSTGSQNVITPYDPRKASRYLPEHELVGMESAREALVGVLLDESPQRTVIPVVGMGGLGKTTLAQQAYNLVQGRFQCHAWVQVPQPYGLEEILRTLLRELFESTKASVPSEIYTMDEAKLINMLREYLKEKKYLVIFDDVWQEEFWGDVEHALIDDKVGGRVMITTRNMQVAEFCKSSSSVHIHEMQRLPAEKAWELFCKRTFKPEGCCPEDLKKISGEIVERCEGLPLAIVVIAGLLSRKRKKANEWHRFQASLSSELKNKAHLTSITKILSLSYNELPYYLKSCFLYFGMFPRRHSIRNGRLIRQWIAEGFVKAAEDKTSEEVAQEYMNELINRSLVEASSIDVTGKARKCRVHDLLHDIILKKTKELSFCRFLSGSSESKFRGITRRLSIVINNSNDDLQDIKFSHVLSVVFREDETLNSTVPVFATNFKFLKVLDFEDAPRLDHLPKDVGNLFDLRYLSVRGTKVSTLPRSVKNLENLETLDLKWSLVYEIPTNMMKKLRKLRHLLGLKVEPNAPFGLIGIKLLCGIGCLQALQKLYHIRLDGEKVDRLLKELKSLTQLRTLGIDKLRSEDGSALCGCIENMKFLESLTITAISENEVIHMESMSSPPQFLGRLALFGQLRKLPEWFTQLQNLVKLRLGYSMLEDDPLEAVQNMHNLLELGIYSDAYVGEQLCFRVGMFPKLKELYLEDLSRLCSLVIEQTAVPMLECLAIGPCPQMKQVPSGLQHLKKLKSVVFSTMPLEFMIFQDFTSVDRVPRVRFLYTNYIGDQEKITLRDLLRCRPDWIREMQEEQEGASTSGTTIEEENK